MFLQLERVGGQGQPMDELCVVHTPQKAADSEPCPVTRPSRRVSVPKPLEVEHSMMNVPSRTPTYREYLRERFSITDHQLTEWLSLRDNRLYCKDLDLLALTRTWGSPLEVGFTPLVTEQVEKMRRVFRRAYDRTGYRGEFVYAYASKAAQYEDLIRTALRAGAHYETSSSMDIEMARLHWRAGNLRNGTLIIVNGFKTGEYLENVLGLKRDGFESIVPVLESSQELRAFRESGLHFDVGIRLKVDRAAQHGDFSKVTSRFGVPAEEIVGLAAEADAAENLNVVMFHAMIDTQCTDRHAWRDALLASFDIYCEVKKVCPHLRSFNFGGGMPVPYSLDFSFDYDLFAEELVQGIMDRCAAEGIEHPDLFGEFGRYTAAAYGFDLYKVAVAKPSHRPGTSWYVINGSLIASLPDVWALNQNFIVLPLNGYDLPITRAWIAGLTCDSDDVYRSGEEEGTIVLPDVSFLPPGEELALGFFMTGAYQDMLSGIGGVHHCLLPEPGELVIERSEDGNGYAFTRAVPSQSLPQMAKLLGYERYLPLLNAEGSLLAA
jgi:arginine decarboxylase